jgi:hypothetical protein
VVGTFVTAADGAYFFEGLEPGSFVAVMTQPVGYATLSDGDSTIPGDDLANASTTDRRVPVTVMAAESDSGNDFLVEAYGAISGSVGRDDNNDNTADTPLGGVVLTLVDGSGNPVDADPNTSGVQAITATTLPDGSFSFTGVPPGVYGVAQTQPAGLLSVSDSDGGNLNLISNITVSAGSTTSGLSFVEEQPGSIAGLVLRDDNNDNIGDSPVSGVLLTLLDNLGNLVDSDPVTPGVQPLTATTDGTGAYTFGNLAPGVYSAAQTQPSGLISVSDVDGGNPNRIDSISVTPGGSVAAQNFVEELPGTISGSVLADDDNNNSGDSPISGVTLTLFSDPNADGDPSDGVLIATTVTNSLGAYTFADQPPGAYVVVQSQPVTHINVTDGDTTVPADDTANASTLDNLIPVTIIGGETDSGNDFVEELSSTISGFVRIDTDGNGSGDTPIAGVTLTLLDGSGNVIDGDPVTPGIQPITAQTEGDGSYVFIGVPPGTYGVAQTVPPTFFALSDADVGSPTTISNIIATAGGTAAGNDFVISPITYSLGNLVFVDANRNGSADAGEGVNGVTVILRDGLGNDIDSDNVTPGVQPTALVTAGGGFYLFTNLQPGDYTLHIPTAEFATGGDLVGRLSLTGQGTDNGIDDLNDENGADSTTPWTSGVSSNVFTLGGTEPTASETGLGGSSDDATDSVVDLTADFGFQGGKSTSFAGWQQQNPLGGQNGATADPDGDGYSNLEEFAFCYNPSSGVTNGCPLHLVVQPDGTVNAVVRRVVGLTGLTYTLQGISNLADSPAGWTDITTIVPTVAANGDGTETATYANIGSLYPSGQGFIRVKVSDGVSTAYTNVDGFTRRTYPAGCTSGSVPYVECPTASGRVTSASGSTLDVAASAGSSSVAAALAPSVQYYLQITDGENEGHRFELDEAATTAGTIAIDLASSLNTQSSLPVSLANDNWVIRPHVTLGDLFPKDNFTPGATATTADRVLFYTNGTWTTYWLRTGPPRKWIRNGDASLEDQSSLIVPPGTGFYTHPRTTAATVTYAGQVLEHDLVVPLVAGSTLVGAPWPLDQSPVSRGMTAAAGFQSTKNPATADSIQFWNGDSVANKNGYTSSSFLTVGGTGRWVATADSSLVSQNNSLIFDDFHSAILKVATAKPNYTMPLPWTP